MFQNRRQIRPWHLRRRRNYVLVAGAFILLLLIACFYGFAENHDAALRDVEQILAKANLSPLAILCATVMMLALMATTGLVLIRSYDQQRRIAELETARVEAEADKARIASEIRLSAQHEAKLHASRFEVALNNMLHGLCMFDAESRVIVCNELYARMYGLTPELVRPGTAYADIVAFRMSNIGYRNLAEVPQPRGPELKLAETIVKRELADGRTILVRSRPTMEGGWIASHEDISERADAEKRLIHMARHDALTGLPNRVLFQERLDGAVAGLQYAQRFAIFCLDLDLFKDINDTLGHPVGDALLRDFAARLQKSVRSNDTVAGSAATNSRFCNPRSADRKTSPGSLSTSPWF